MPDQLKAHNTRPYTIINCAMSLDGKLALPSGKPVKLSSPEDFKRVHELRNYCDAVLVGINTILMDDPKLSVKSEFVKNPIHPIRIVLDTSGRTPKNAKVLNDSAITYIIIGNKFKSKDNKFKNAEVLYCPENKAGQIDLNDMLSMLKSKGTEILLVEGGSTVIYNFLKNKLVDELYVYLNHTIIGGIDTPTLAGGSGAKSIEDIIKLRLLSCEALGDGLLLKYKA